MNHAEALHVLLNQLEEFRGQSYDQLVAAIGEEYRFDLAGDSGDRYLVAIDARWESSLGGDVRVIGSIDSISSEPAVPFSLSFLKKPAERTTS